MAVDAVADLGDRPAATVRVLVVGATGYIGQAVVKELVRRGYDASAQATQVGQTEARCWVLGGCFSSSLRGLWRASRIHFSSGLQPC